LYGVYPMDFGGSTQNPLKKLLERQINQSERKLCLCKVKRNQQLVKISLVFIYLYIVMRIISHFYTIMHFVHTN
jgi:hypothetical protein